MKRLYHLSLLAVGTLLFAGCATKGYVNEEIAALEARLNESMNQSLASRDASIASNKRTAEDALRRATEAGKLAQGHLLGQTVMSNDEIRFTVNAYTLSDEAKAVLSELVGELKRENRDVYIEVQGHTDATGSEAYNLELGKARAEAVVNYLHREHQIPLHRLSSYSYGETMPVADNATKAGRALNRRVVVVVME